MKKAVKITAFVLFIISLLYYVFWLVYSFYLYFAGIGSGWLIPSLSNGDMHYGWEAFGDGIGMGFIVTLYMFWFVPLYQILYLIVNAVILIRKKVNKK